MSAGWKQGQDWRITYCFSQSVSRKGRSKSAWWTTRWGWKEKRSKTNNNNNNNRITLFGDALQNSQGHIEQDKTLTAQGTWRKAEPWPASAAIVQAGTASKQSEKSAGKGLKSRAAIGRPTAGDRSRWVKVKSTQFNNTSANFSFYLLQTLVFGSKLLQIFDFLKKMTGIFVFIGENWIMNYCRHVPTYLIKVLQLLNCG